MDLKLPREIHTQLDAPAGGGDSWTVSGGYHYYHYRCDGCDDVGWGCGYRTLQNLCSWARHQLALEGISCPEVPDIPGIQKALVSMGDKSHSFCGSRDWIGSVEVAICMDYFFDVPCKIIHIPKGRDLIKHTEELCSHFRTIGAPVMMGGETDNCSKGIMGICKSEHDAVDLLVLDPHFHGSPATFDALVEKDMLLWRPLETFNQDSFYNLCLPQYKKGSHQPQQLHL